MFNLNTMFGILLNIIFIHLAGAQLILSFLTNTPAPPSFSTECKDQINNCEYFGQDACKGEYEPWAKINCALTCKFCDGPPTQPPPCVDKLSDCQSYEKGACTEAKYGSWAQANCRQTCRLCTAQQLAAIDAAKTTIPANKCVDKVNCELYTKAACNQSYEAWAKENCMAYCGFCVGLPTTPKPCVDILPNCANYQANMCTDPQFRGWADDHCRKFCKFCPAGIVPTPPPLTPPLQKATLLTPPPLGPGRK